MQKQGFWKIIEILLGDIGNRIMVEIGLVYVEYIE